MKKFEIIEHTADIGIKIYGKDLRGLFITAAEVMFGFIAQKKPRVKINKSKVKDIVVKQKGEDLEELFVNWLNELLSLSATKELIFFSFKINKLDGNALEAVIRGDDIKNYKVNTEIKAATYHELKIENINSYWQAQVIFDV